MPPSQKRRPSSKLVAPTQSVLPLHHPKRRADAGRRPRGLNRGHGRRSAPPLPHISKRSRLFRSSIREECVAVEAPAPATAPNDPCAAPSPYLWFGWIRRRPNKGQSSRNARPISGPPPLVPSEGCHRRVPDGSLWQVLAKPRRGWRPICRAPGLDTVCAWLGFVRARGRINSRGDSMR